MRCRVGSYASFLLFLTLLSPLCFAEEQIPSDKTSPLPPPNLYAEQFFLKPDQRLRHRIAEIRGLLFIETPSRERNTRYSVVTNFGGGALKSRYVPGLSSLEDARKWLEENLETASFQGVEIRRVRLPLKEGETTTLFWVGHKAFPTADAAGAQIVSVQSVVESQGGNFEQMVKEAEAAFRIPEETPPVEIKTPAQFQKEEEIMLKFLDQLNIGEETFGPFQGEGVGEPILWQSFGETSWRMTNLDKKNFSDQVGFWTNRLVVKGIWTPLNTVDPFVESTAALESNGKDFASHLDLSAGLEWRPFARNAWFYNFRPWSLPLLEWVRSYRLYFQYMDRKNLKDEIAGSRDYDIRTGFQIFYEWGIDLPSLAEGPPSTIPDYLRQYIWGEYFGDYRFHTNNFTSDDDFDAWILNSSIILGVRMPGIPLPDNPINHELVLMPYLRLEHVNNTQFSFHYENYLFLSAGVRWMPFRTYRFKENEWLSKVKVFGEWVGIGDVQHGKQDGEAPAETPVHDLRFGVSLSSRRF